MYCGPSVRGIAFLSTLSLRRATRQLLDLAPSIRFLSTLSLRRATHCSASSGTCPCSFYPRSPCGERLRACRWWSALPPCFYPRSPCGERRRRRKCSYRHPGFYPRSPCGERPPYALSRGEEIKFLSTLSLRRATSCSFRPFTSHGGFLSTLSLRRATLEQSASYNAHLVSIHALLAESDERKSYKRIRPERFLSTLSLRRATPDTMLREISSRFYPRSPCGERPVRLYRWPEPVRFLSTLSLRRATRTVLRSQCSWLCFYPRSPCGERPAVGGCYALVTAVSIHALLAESDGIGLVFLWWGVRFLSTLSLRRATRRGVILSLNAKFLSTLSLRRATREHQKHLT